MKKNIVSSLIIIAFERGYHMDKNGNIYNSDGYKLTPFTVKGCEYLYITMWDRSRWSYPKRIPVHRFMAYLKFGNSIFEDGVHVRHLDGNSLNNSWDNIEIGTASENQMDIPEEIRIRSATIASRKMQDNIRSYEERCLIYEDLKNGLPYSEIMKKHNLSSKGTLSYMKNKSKEYKQYTAPG